MILLCTFFFFFLSLEAVDSALAMSSSELLFSLSLSLTMSSSSCFIKLIFFVKLVQKRKKNRFTKLNENFGLKLASSGSPSSDSSISKFFIFNSNRSSFLFSFFMALVAIFYCISTTIKTNIKQLKMVYLYFMLKIIQ
jgi:hypothetical protein